MRLSIQTRSGKELIAGGLEVGDQATTQDLQKTLHSQKPNLYPSRQRLTLPTSTLEKKPTVLAPEEKLTSYGLKNGSVILFKDLGAQVGYSTVFFWEYFGPLLVYSFIYFFPHTVYCWEKHIPKKTSAQRMALGYWTLHYSKRILETFFVHKFSHATMPIFNLYKNCGYYWGFAAYVAYFVNHPLYTPPNSSRSLLLFAVALLCQLSNLWCHVILANLRPAGQKGYVIPRGFLFEYITCPNYTVEILGWVCFAFATSSLPAFFFVAAGSFQMWQWAAGKHARLRRIFDGKNGKEKYPKRWVMLPPFY